MTHAVGAVKKQLHVLVAWQQAALNMQRTPNMQRSAQGLQASTATYLHHFPDEDSGSERDGTEQHDDFVMRMVDRGKVRLGDTSSSTSTSSSGSESSGDDLDIDVAPDLEAFTDALTTFESFEDLKAYAESLMKCKLSNNNRTTKHPPKWLQAAFPDAKSYWMNGTLYCMQAKCDHQAYVPWAKTTCTCFVRYSLCPVTTKWKLGKGEDKCCTSHNHELEKMVTETSATGLTHYRSALALDQDMIQTIHSWFDAMIGE
jgi:hypothetical protein